MFRHCKGVLPILVCHGGADWRERQVTKSKVVGRQQTSRIGFENIWKYTEELINANVERGNILDE